MILVFVLVYSSSYASVIQTYRFLSQKAANIWREQMQRNTLNSTMSKTLESQKEFQMEQRLRSNPMDEEANKYFGDKIRKKNVQEQYTQMMEEFPESMGRVLMLYIDAKVNDSPIHAFVDSGAQSSKFY